MAAGGVLRTGYGAGPPTALIDTRAIATGGKESKADRQG